MLLESALAELSIDILDDLQPQMLLHVTTPTVAAAQCPYGYTELQICKPSSEPITRYEEKEERQNGSSTRDMMHFSQDREKYNVYRAPGRVPFRWEIQPGVPKSPQRESELRDEDEDQSSPVPLKLPPSASPAAAAAASTASSASPKKNAGGCFSWNLSQLSTQSIHVCEGSVQRGNIQGYDGDDEEDIIPSNLELDSKEEWSPVSTLELPESPGSSSLISPVKSNNPARFIPPFDDFHETMPSGTARNASTTLLWGLFPFKCIFLPSFKQKGKKKHSTGHQDREDSKVSSNSPPVQLTSALKKKNSRSGSCNRNYCNSAAGMKQVRFSVETDAYFSSSNEEGGGETVPPPTQMDWASYGLF
uniref:Uncharacterized protein n=1 Tax=Picea sitchensis TaxID=3332 RepID=A9NW63_PICSI|nr:unknown [Picea sitchensis]